MNRIGVLFHPKVARTIELAREVALFLEGKGIEVWTGSAWECEAGRQQVAGTDLILTTGGDGTILRAAQIVLGSSVPVTGINLGRLGFLTEIAPANYREDLTCLLAGEGWLDERAMLEALVEDAGEMLEQPLVALNDVVVARGAVARVVHVSTRLNGEPFTTYRADGVIVATATGSTGYSLSAGGPILPPGSPDLLLTPILPHPGPAYPILLDKEAVVEFSLETPHEATLSVDGSINIPLKNGAIIKVRRSREITRFLRLGQGSNFYRTLEAKLKRKH